MSSAAVTTGARAPGFELMNQLGQSVTLEELRSDRAVLLVFFPFAFSGICTGELTEIRDDYGRFDNDQVRTVGISCDPMFALRAWDDQEALFFPLLSDFWPHGATARDYGVFEERRGFANRGTFLVDTDGIVRWSLVTDSGQRRDFAGFHAAVEELAAGTRA